METKIIKGKNIADRFLKNLKEQISYNQHVVRLDIIQIGDNFSSGKYVQMKKLAGEDIGIEVVVHKFDDNVSQSEVIELITSLNENSSVSGVMVQLPLPESLETRVILDTIHPSKDVDGLTSKNMDAIIKNESPFYTPATARAVIEVLKTVDTELKDKEVVVLGNSLAVGYPLSYLLKPMVKSVIVCDENTPNIPEISSTADIIISATGHPHLINNSYIKTGAIVIDVGFEVGKDGKPVGDVDTQDVLGIASYLVPSPGGVGPMTVAMLMQNTFEAYLKYGK